jgi:hypothetical protein
MHLELCNYIGERLVFPWFSEDLFESVKFRRALSWATLVVYS